MSSISAVLIVFNEEQKIDACLASLKWVDEIIVVDGESQDRTLPIAAKYSSKLYTRPFDNFADQKNYGVDLASGDWILSIDADERVSPQLRASIEHIAKEGSPFDAFWIRRTNFLFGRPLRFGGQGGEKVLRFFRQGRGRFEQPVHEKLKVGGKIGNLDGDLLHFSSATVYEYMKKLNLYTDLEARRMAEQRGQPAQEDFFLKPLLRFFYFYFVRLGFLDGYEGFLYHSLSSFYYFLKYAKLREILQHGIEGKEKLLCENRN